MALLVPAGTGLAVGPHPTIANLWVREVDPTKTTVYPPPIITGVIKSVATGSNPDTTANIYSHGCILTQVDGTTNLSAQWENTGSYASPSWKRWAV